MNHDAWPALPYEAWMPTKKTLHMCAQMIGKARLALSPPQPEWLHACLYLDGRDSPRLRCHTAPTSYRWASTYTTAPSGSA